MKGNCLRLKSVFFPSSNILQLLKENFLEEAKKLGTHKFNEVREEKPDGKDDEAFREVGAI